MCSREVYRYSNAQNHQVLPLTQSWKTPHSTWNEQWLPASVKMLPETGPSSLTRQLAPLAHPSTAEFLLGMGASLLPETATAVSVLIQSSRRSQFSPPWQMEKTWQRVLRLDLNTTHLFLRGGHDAYFQLSFLGLAL